MPGIFRDGDLFQAFYRSSEVLLHLNEEPSLFLDADKVGSVKIVRPVAGNSAAG